MQAEIVRSRTSRFYAAQLSPYAYVVHVSVIVMRFHASALSRAAATPDPAPARQPLGGQTAVLAVARTSLIGAMSPCHRPRRVLETAPRWVSADPAPPPPGTARRRPAPPIPRRSALRYRSIGIQGQHYRHTRHCNRHAVTVAQLEIDHAAEFGGAAQS